MVVFPMTKLKQQPRVEKKMRDKKSKMILNVVHPLNTDEDPNDLSVSVPIENRMTTKEKKKCKEKTEANSNKGKESIQKQTMMKHKDDKDEDGNTTNNSDSQFIETESHQKVPKTSSRSEERKALLNQVPKIDTDGIAYTKLQLRRMAKRVKRGLPPIPTPQEEHERLQQERELQKEDDLEMAGMLYDKSKMTGRKHANERDEKEKENDSEEEYPTTQEQNNQPSTDWIAPEPFLPSKTNPQPPSKKTKRTKPVPQDYTCMACSIKGDHWIYDCQNKVTKKGTNLVAKKLRGIHHPDAKKIFVSGLPFEMKKTDVEGMFADCGSIVQCKLVTFADTGRCKGQAFITFESDEGAMLALKLNGQVLQNEPAPKKGNKKVMEQIPKELRLKVTKVLNRIQTKGSNLNSKLNNSVGN